MFYRFLTLILVSGLFISSPALAGYKEGKSAFDSKDWFQAIVHLRPLAEAGDDRAQLLLGKMYSNAWGVKKDFKAAYKLYHSAALNGNSAAMVAVGTSLIGGLGVEKDLKASTAWFRQAAELNDVMAQFTLATILLKNYDETKTKDNLLGAYKWFRITSKYPDTSRVTDTAEKIATQLAADQLSTDEISKLEEEISAWRPISKEQYLQTQKNDTEE